MVLSACVEWDTPFLWVCSEECLSVPAGNVSPEQVAQAVAEQIAQQTRQQMSHAGGEAPLPLLGAIQNYMQALESMYRGERTAAQQLFDLPPVGQTAGTARCHQAVDQSFPQSHDWKTSDLRSPLPKHTFVSCCCGSYADNMKLQNTCNFEDFSIQHT